ncbi:PKD domain-containing protein [Candidatus Woesearchaeota archaeon]|nr:PKD domain-containing protein [Candidatus Woesearchaeota archaeon]
MVKKMSVFKVLLFLMALMFAFSAVAEESLSLNAVPSSGKAPLEVTFNLVSSEEILSVSWDFNGDGIEDSTELAPTFVYGAGTHIASANVTTASGSTIVSTTITVDEPFSVSVIAVPSSGIAPLTVKFTASVSEFPDKNTIFMYSWDFNNDGVVDSVEQNPSYTFENVGDVVAQLKVRDAASSFDGMEVSKQIPITVSSYDSKINIVSYFPTALQLKENQITFLVSNEGPEPIKDISAKVIGEGIQHLSSTTISRLKPGEQDSLTVKMNVLKEGQLTASVKIDEKIFPVTFAVAEQVRVNKEELELKLKELKQKLQEQEDLYYEKKAENYLVAEVFENIKATKKQLQDAQQQLLTNNLLEAKVNVDLAGPTIEDIAYRLGDAQKPKQTPLLWLKENAVAITSIIAAVGTLGGVAVKISKGAQKLGGDVKEKFTAKKKDEKVEDNASEADDKSKDEPEEEKGSS